MMLFLSTDFLHCNIRTFYMELL